MTKKAFAHGRQIAIIAIAVVFALAFTGCDMETKIEPDHDHQWGDWTQHRAAGCTEAEVLIRTCALDSAHVEYGTGDDAIGHDWHDEIVMIPATETKNGIIARFCRIDPEHITETDEFSGEYATGTAGLVFNLIDNNTAYRVHDGGNKTFTAVHIPAYHRPDANSPYLPVTQIGNSTNSTSNSALGTATSAVTAVTFAEDSRLTTISSSAFTAIKNLTSITIPEGVTSIGSNAFSNAGLTSITLPESLTSIGNGAFAGSGLTSITIPDSVKVINPNMFQVCKELVSINLPEDAVFSTPNIVGNQFYDCQKLESINIPTSVTFIPQNAFWSCFALKNITIPEGVTYIGNSSFQWCIGLTSITIPASVTSISSNAFNGCTDLTSVTFQGNAAVIANVNSFPGSLKTFYDAQSTKAGTYTFNGTAWEKTEL